MIFRTINADAKKLTEQFGLLNKSFQDIKKDFANGLGFKNSLFQTSISKTDYQALQKFNSAIKVTNDGLTKSQRITKAWNENMTGCSVAAKRMGNDLVTGKKNIQDVSKAMNTASGSTKALGVAMNVMANVGFMLAITAITKVISELAQAQDNAVQAAKEATETYKSELNSIADYKQRLSELHEELKSGNLSYEETKTKRTELMTIQDELIEKFGTEKSAIESVTDAVKGQIDALDDLNEKAYRDWIAKADEQTFWNKLLPGGKSGLDQAIDYMESKKTVSFMDMQNANLSDELQALQKEIDETIRAKYNLDKTFAMFNVTGTPDEIRSQLENIRQDYADISKRVFKRKKLPRGMWDEYRKETTDSINEAILSLDKGLEKHQDTYRTYIEGLIKYDSEYSDEYANILQKRAELESAQNSGNAEEVKRAKQEFMDSINDAIITSESDENIKRYFESLYPELQAEFSNWKFEFDLEANKDSIADVAKEIGEKYTATDLLGMIDDESATIADSAFNSLIDKAIEYGICTDKSSEEVQKLIDLLFELGIVQDNVKGDTFNDKHSVLFDQAWADSFTSENETVKELGNTLLDLAEKGRLTKETFNEADSTAGGYFKNLGISADIAVSKINKLVDESKQLSSMSDQISSMAEALATKKSNGFVEADTLSGFDVEVRGLESWDRFQEVLGSTTSSYQECQEAANALATEWVNSSDFLAQLTEDTKEYYKTQLESMGVENYDEVIESTLALKEAKEALIDVDLSDASYEDIEALIAEGEYSALVTEQMWALYYAKLAESGTFLDSSADCAQLQALANDAMLTAEAVELLNQLIQIYNGLEAGAYNNNRALRAEAVAEATRIKTELENLAKGEGAGLIAKPEIKVNGNKGKKSGGSGSSKDKWKEQYDAELKELEHMHKLGLISDEEYWKARMDLNEKYFGESSGMHEKYLEEYQENEEDILEGLKKLWEDYYDERKNNLKDLISYAEKLYDKEIDSYESSIKVLEEKRDTEKKYWQGRIDAIGDEIDALEDANDERERAIDLQQKQWNLQKAMHQRTMLINYMSDTIVI